MDIMGAVALVIYITFTVGNIVGRCLGCRWCADEAVKGDKADAWWKRALIDAESRQRKRELEGK